MKKVYIIPNTLVVKVETQPMLSDSVNNLKTEKSQTYNNSLSRGGNSDWDDED